MAMDTISWLAGTRDKQNPTRPSIGQSTVASLTIEAFQENGLPDDLISAREELVAYMAEVRAIELDA